MNKIESRLGLTPALKRIAYYYLCLGFGEYSPNGGKHPHYNKVIVRDFYEFKDDVGGVIVEFFKEGRRIRWVEFRNQVVGGGGDSVIQSVTS